MKQVTMQKLLWRRLTDTPLSIPHAQCNCGLPLNSPEGRDSVAGLTTRNNNSDAALTLTNGGLKDNMLVFVVNKDNTPLMPCKPAKARKLIRDGKAQVIRRTPFTIKLNWDCEKNVQSITLGVDAGYIHIGLSAVTEKSEVFSADVQLRTDIVELNSERRQYRRSRRYRKTWYRKPRFLNRKKPEGWLAPSIQHKLDSHIKLIEWVKSLLPISSIVVEVASFDIQKIKNPSIEGIEYQQGEQYGYANIREYVLHRDGHKCRQCGGKSKDRRLEIHHLQTRKNGGDRPDNLVTLCKTCHDKVTKGILKPDIKTFKGFKAETFMTAVRWKLIDQLIAKGYSAKSTFGYITKVNRQKAGLPKSHINDAFAIAGGNSQTRTGVYYLIKQVRKCNRKLFKGERSHIKNTAPRFIYGFQRYDKVRWNGQECFIFGRRSSGYFDLRMLDGTKCYASAKASSITLLERAKTILIERRLALSSPLQVEGSFQC